MSVLVQPEMERGRSPLVSIPPFGGGDFQGIDTTTVPITQAGTNVNEGEVPLRMKYRQLLAVALGVGIAGGMRIK